MANVRKITRPDGTRFYQVRWRTPDGKHRTKGGFPTKRAAEDYVNEVDYAQRRSTTFDPKAGAVSFREAAQDWLSSRHDLKRSTHAGYAYALAPADERRAAVNASSRAARELGIDARFGGYPINKITRQQISGWVEAMAASGSKPSTVRNAYFLVRMVLAQGVVDGRLTASPADYVRLPSERSAVSGTPGVVDDPAQFLTAAQVAALVNATPWPYTVTVHLAAWAGLRAAELCGLQVGDVELPAPTINPNAPAKPGLLRVERTVIVLDGELTYDTPKTKGSRRRVPLTPATVAVMRDYLAEHPHGPASADPDPTAPLFPSMRLIAEKPTGVKATDADGRRIVARAEQVLAGLSVEDAEVGLDGSAPARHLLQGRLSACGAAGDPARHSVLRGPSRGHRPHRGRDHPSRRGPTAQVAVPRPEAHVRLAVRRSGHPPVGHRELSWPLEGDDHDDRLRTPVRGRPWGRDGRARRDGDADTGCRERGAVPPYGLRVT